MRLYDLGFQPPALPFISPPPSWDNNNDAYPLIGAGVLLVPALQVLGPDVVWPLVRRPTVAAVLQGLEI